VAQHDDFDSQLRAIPAEPAKDLKDATEGSVDEREGHGLGILALPQTNTKILVFRLDELPARTGQFSPTHSKQRSYWLC
jgi:hypothetical protein